MLRRALANVARKHAAASTSDRLGPRRHAAAAPDGLSAHALPAERRARLRAAGAPARAGSRRHRRHLQFLVNILAKELQFQVSAKNFT